MKTLLEAPGPIPSGKGLVRDQWQNERNNYETELALLQDCLGRLGQAVRQWHELHQAKELNAYQLGLLQPVLEALRSLPEAVRLDLLGAEVEPFLQTLKVN
ncbi:MAG: hypothetical protein JWP00_842 [Chloroflexi bacterium]|jgi:Ser/Thr protein kinase RdoA (MazF antagonist)|nr:hypothetical protein [Chloroflexota bacterium]